LLIIPQQQKAIIYRIDGTSEEVQGFNGNSLRGEDVFARVRINIGCTVWLMEHV
jgi:hypothetical protein